MLAIANHAAHQGKAATSIPEVVSALRERWSNLTLCAYQPPFDLLPAIQHELQTAAPQIIAIGGDGTVNRVLNAILQLTNGNARRVMLGAVGLGSSNDAVKPPTQRISGWSAKADPAQARAVDVVRVTCQSANAAKRTRYALANVGLGAIAEANRRFNETGSGLRAIKKQSMALALNCVALRTIITWRGLKVRLQIDGQPEREALLDTLSVLKIPWIAGGFHYDVHTARDSGMLDVCLCEGVGRRGLLRLMRDLARGRFEGGAGRLSFAARSVGVVADEPLAIECDGEVESCREARIEVVPRAIQWMG